MAPWGCDEWLKGRSTRPPHVKASFLGKDACGPLMHRHDSVIHVHYRVSALIFSFPDGSDSKESTCNAGDPGLIPGSGRSPGEGNGYPL